MALRPTDHNDDQEAVAANVRALMGRHRVSGVQLAKEIDLDPSTLSRKLAGKRDFTVRELGRIARFFGKRLSELMGDEAAGFFQPARLLRDLYNEVVIDITRNPHPLYEQGVLFDTSVAVSQQPVVGNVTSVTVEGGTELGLSPARSSRRAA